MSLSLALLFLLSLYSFDMARNDHKRFVRAVMAVIQVMFPRTLCFAAKYLWYIGSCIVGTRRLGSAMALQVIPALVTQNIELI